MKVSDAVRRIRTAAHDISAEYTEEECIALLNTAMAETAALLAALRYPPLLREVTIRTGDTLPADWIAPAGGYPMKVTAGRAEVLTADAITCRYFAAPKPLDSAADTFPLMHPLIEEAIVQTAVIRALESREYDTAAEQAHLGELKNALAAVLGGKR